MAAFNLTPCRLPLLASVWIPGPSVRTHTHCWDRVGNVNVNVQRLVWTRDEVVFYLSGILVLRGRLEIASSPTDTSAWSMCHPHIRFGKCEDRPKPQWERQRQCAQCAGESTTCVTHRRRIFTHVSSSSETDRWGIARNHRRDTQVRSGCRTWTFQQQTASVLTITMLRYFRFHCSSVNFKQDVRKIQRNVTQTKTKPITWVCLV